MGTTGQTLDTEGQIGDGIIVLNTADITFAAMTWLEQDVIPRLIVDIHLRVLWKNAPATAYLARKRCVEVRDRTFGATSAKDQEALLALLATPSAGAACLEMTKPAGSGWLLVTACRLPASGGDLFGLTLIDTGSFQPSYRALDTAFGLTKAEAGLLQLLLTGQSVQSIASTSGTKVTTARKHIRNIYQKLDVSSREQVFHKLQAFRE